MLLLCFCPYPFLYLVYHVRDSWRRLASADARAPNMVSVSRARHDARGDACLASRWRVIGREVAELLQARCEPASSSFLVPPLFLFGLEGPSLRGHLFLLFLLLSFLFCCALPPVAVIRDASTTESHLELPRCEPEHRPRPSFRTVKARRCEGRCMRRCNEGIRVGTSRGASNMKGR